MHDHAPGVRGASNRRLLAISLALTATVMVVQVVGAIWTGSLALLADAAHMFTDSSALVIALVASIVAARPANERNTYGYQRAEVFGALANAVILIVLSVWIAVEGVQRLVGGGEVEVAGGLMLVVAVVGLVANGVSMYLLSAAQRHSINVRGAYLEVLGDLLGSAAVIVAGVVIVFTDWFWVDQAASILIALLILPRAYSLLRDVVNVLLEASPEGVDVEEARAHMLAVPGVVEVHDVHAWTITSGVPAFSAHVIVDDTAWSEEAYHAILDELKTCLREHFGTDHSTLQLEPEGHRRPGAHRHE